MSGFTAEQVYREFQDVMDDCYPIQKKIQKMYEEKNTTVMTKAEKNELIEKSVVEFKKKVALLW